jgi:hypothetical protein
MAILDFPRTPQQRIDSIRFTCSCCGEDKQGLMALAKILPDAVFFIPEEERERRVKTGSDLCSIDDEHFFARAVLEIPIRKTNATFDFGVWGSLSRENFQIYFDEFDNPAPTFGPFFSWLSSSLPPYPDLFTSELRSVMEFRSGNQRPIIRLDPCDYPLAIDQHNGITVDKVKEIYAAWGHTALI